MPVPWSYTLLMLAAIATCALLLRRSQAALDLSGWEKFGLGIGAFCGAMIGAKLPFVLADWEGLVRGTAWLSHGKTIMSGIVGGYFGVELAKWAMGVRIKTGDSFAAPVAAAVAIGRVACFFGGCCYGTPTSLPWGVVFSSAADDPLVPRHPTQLYESLFHATAAVILVWMRRNGLFRGQLIKLYIIAYLLYRFATELVRPEPRWLLGMTGYQWAAIALVLLFVWLWVRDQQLAARTA
jgi:phosphatidylglycerol:prolipoprotein diacylglycerol transferase